MSDGRYVVRFFQFHKQSAMECEDLDGAVAFLGEGVNNGWCSPLDIIGPDGAVLLSGEALTARLDGYSDWVEANADVPYDDWAAANRVSHRRG